MIPQISLQETHLRSKDRNRRKVKGHRKILHTNSNQKTAGVATLMAGKTDHGKVNTDKKRLYMLLKPSI